MINFWCPNFRGTGEKWPAMKYRSDHLSLCDVTFSVPILMISMWRSLMWMSLIDRYCWGWSLTLIATDSMQLRHSVNFLQIQTDLGLYETMISIWSLLIRESTGDLFFWFSFDKIFSCDFDTTKTMQIDAFFLLIFFPMMRSCVSVIECICACKWVGEIIGCDKFNFALVEIAFFLIGFLTSVLFEFENLEHFFFSSIFICNSFAE